MVHQSFSRTPDADHERGDKDLLESMSGSSKRYTVDTVKQDPKTPADTDADADAATHHPLTAAVAPAAPPKAATATAL